MSACNVDVLPDRPRFRALIEAWRVKRMGGDPGPLVFAPAKEPDERPALPLVGGIGVAGLLQTIEDQKRGYLKRWGLLESYDKMLAERKGGRGA